MTVSEANKKEKEFNSCWSITINNPTSDDFQQWESLKTHHWVKEVSGQLEKGENGTPHIQGMLKTRSVRFAQIKKALPRAHIEVAKNPTALARYVSKTETRIGEIPTVKVATQKEVQSYCLMTALGYCSRWSNYPDPLSYNDEEMLIRWEARLAEQWESILDDSVKLLIRQGFYGVEFVVANPQVRTAFKKYFVPILYRTLDGRNKEAETRNQASSTSATSAQGQD